MKRPSAKRWCKDQTYCIGQEIGLFGQLNEVTMLDRSQFKSVEEAVTALNDLLIHASDYCAVYSQRRQAFYLLWPSEKTEADVNSFALTVKGGQKPPAPTFQHAPPPGQAPHAVLQQTSAFPMQNQTVSGSQASNNKLKDQFRLDKIYYYRQNQNQNGVGPTSVAGSMTSTTDATPEQTTPANTERENAVARVENGAPRVEAEETSPMRRKGVENAAAVPPAPGQEIAKPLAAPAPIFTRTPSQPGLAGVRQTSNSQAAATPPPPPSGYPINLPRAQTPTGIRRSLFQAAKVLSPRRTGTPLRVQPGDESMEAAGTAPPPIVVRGRAGGPGPETPNGLPGTRDRVASANGRPRPNSSAIERGASVEAVRRAIPRPGSPSAGPPAPHSFNPPKPRPETRDSKENEEPSAREEAPPPEERRAELESLKMSELRRLGQQLGVPEELLDSALDFETQKEQKEVLVGHIMKVELEIAIQRLGTLFPDIAEEKKLLENNASSTFLDNPGGSANAPPVLQRTAQDASGRLVEQIRHQTAEYSMIAQRYSQKDGFQEKQTESSRPAPRILQAPLRAFATEEEEQSATIIKFNKDTLGQKFSQAAMQMQSMNAEQPVKRVAQVLPATAPKAVERQVYVEPAAVSSSASPNNAAVSARGSPPSEWHTVPMAEVTAMSLEELRLDSDDFDPIRPSQRALILERLGLNQASVIESLQDNPGSFNDGVWIVLDGISTGLVLKLVPHQRSIPSRATDTEKFVGLQKACPKIASEFSLTFPIKVFQLKGPRGNRCKDLIVMRRASGLQLTQHLYHKVHGQQIPHLLQIFLEFGVFICKVHRVYKGMQHGDCQPSNVFYDELLGIFTLIDVADFGFGPYVADGGDNDVEHFICGLRTLTTWYGEQLLADCERQFRTGYMEESRRRSK